MKRVTYVALLIFLFNSCSYKTIYLKGSYQTKPFETVTTSSLNEVWDKLIDLFAQKGLGIKLIDKSSGLIVAHNSLVPVTRENEKGQLVDPTAWVVSTSIYEPGSRKYYYPTTASVEWNVRIKDLGNNTTSINVNMVNILANTVVTQINPVFVSGTSTSVNTAAVSTGVFEKIIADLIK